MRKLFLHIGFDKTGTTSIQRFIADQHTHLPHILFPYLDGSFSPPRRTEFSHHLFAEAFLTTIKEAKVIDASRLKILQKQKPKLTMKDILDGFKAQLDNNDDRPAVISSETFSRTTIDPKAVYEFIKDYDYKVIAVLRRQDGYAKSKYSQVIKHKARVKTKITVPKFDNFMKPNSLDYHAKLKRWVDAGVDPKRIQILPFERALMPNGVIPYLFEAMNIELKGVNYDDYNTNTSLGDFEILALQWYLSKQNVDNDEKRLLVIAAMENSGKITGLPKGSFISADIRKQILENSAESNAKIVRDFMPGHDGLLFSSHIKNEDEAIIQPDNMLMRKYIRRLRFILRNDGLLKTR